MITAMARRWSIALRAMLALVLILGFYLLALALAAGLLALPLLVRAEPALRLRLLFITLPGAAIVLWSIRPRRDPFVAPGPLLARDANPRLFQEIDAVQRQTEQAPMTEVYLGPDVNAATARVGGFMGIRGRSVLVVGLPLLAVLTVSQFRAVLAHEFGHHYGGETRLAPFVYRTREAILRTAATLAQEGRRFLQVPFVWYAHLFLRATLAVSRRQELAADALSVKVAGCRAAAEGLTRSHVAALAMPVFLRMEFVPVVEVGRLPLLIDGFVRFMRAKPVVETLDQLLESELAGGETSPFDSHPSLGTRLARLESLSDSAFAQNDSSGTTLLGDADEEERRLVGGLLRSGTELQAIAWDSVPEEVEPRIWRSRCEEFREPLAAMTVRDIATLPTEWQPISRRLLGSSNPPEPRLGIQYVLGAALSLKLLERGWSAEGDVGESTRFRRGERQLLLAELLHGAVNGTTAREDWEALLRDAELEPDEVLFEPEPAGVAGASRER